MLVTDRDCNISVGAFSLVIGTSSDVDMRDDGVPVSAVPRDHLIFMLREVKHPRHSWCGELDLHHGL